MTKFQVGDPVIFQMTKQSSHPTLRATQIAPAENGDSYCYVVEKFWVVKEILHDQKILVQTRRGKTRIVSTSDPRLKRAGWWDRWINKDRFPDLAIFEQAQKSREKQDQNANSGVTI